MKNLQKKSILILLIFISTMLVTACNNKKDSEFIELYANDPANTVQKGDYTFSFKEGKDFNNELQVFFKSDKKPVVNIKGQFFFALVNDEKIYYAQNDKNEQTTKVVSVDLKTAISNAIKSYENHSNLTLDYIYGDDIYLSIWTEDSSNAHNYICSLNKLNVKTGQSTRVLNDAVSSKLGKTKILYQKTVYDYGPYPLYASDLQGQNSREIADKVLFYKPIEGKIYYIELDDETNKPHLFIVGEDGNNPTKISDEINGTFFIDVTKTHIIYSRYEEETEEFLFYEMEISSGNIKEIPKPEFQKYKQQVI